MRLELIEKVKEKDILADDILTPEGKTLLKAGTSLTDEYIRILKRFGVFYLYLEDSRLYDVSISNRRLSQLKKDTLKNMYNIIKDVNECNEIRLKESLKVVEDLVEYIESTGRISNSLYDVKTYDNYTYLHCVDTCIMSAFLGYSLGFRSDDLKEIGIAGLLHDIGKTKISPEIINKKSPLTKEEFLEIKKHPIYGADLLMNMRCISDSVLHAVVQHHERIDGKGYPYRLRDKEIDLFSKVVSICDVYNAVSNDRAYRKKFSLHEAYELILSGADSMFDIELVRKFKETFAVYPLGCCIKLTNGVEGYVIKQNMHLPDRPVIRVLYDSETGKNISSYEIDLSLKTNVEVISMI